MFLAPLVAEGLHFFANRGNAADPNGEEAVLKTVGPSGLGGSSPSCGGLLSIRMVREPLRKRLAREGLQVQILPAALIIFNNHYYLRC